MLTTSNRADRREQISVDPGTQCLLSVPSMRSPLERLPADAFENLLVVSVTRSPTKIERTVREMGGEPSKVGVVPVSGSSINYDGPLWVADVVGPTDLTGINLRFSNAMRHVEPGAGWVVFDNVNVLLMYAQSDSVYQFLSAVISQARSRQVRGVYAVVRDAITDETYASVRELFDEEFAPDA
ncbi:hypothetical protein [Halostella sp. PRR32]|uniref:DUF7504 family protein n=1 Tax=Halostella sp. PRR32 TaxID=3098147 RepID=UPI002B1DF549|nr:hypothetical protein [Halostella sp. PRR32]